MRGRRLIPALIFVATYAALAAGRVPYLNLRRTGAATLGAIVMIAAGGIPVRDALRAIDLRTLVLLLAMMALVAPFRIAGVFGRVAGRLSRAVGHPAALVAVIVIASGILSALLINDTVCVVFTPIVLELARLRRRRPLPYLVALATSSNIGSVATLVGNPQNILIGSLSRLGVWPFTRALAPIALAGLAIDIVVICVLFRRELTGMPGPHGESPARGFGESEAAHPPGWRAFAHAIDWNLLLLFAALFVVVAGGERAGVDRRIFDWLRPVGMQTLAGLSATVAILSNVVSNVPAVMLFAPIVPRLPDPARAWLALAMASTLAGNLTILGSIANLIVVEAARRRGARVSFGDYLKVGIPVTLLTMAFGVWWLT